MNINFFNDTENVIFKCIFFGKKSSLLFWQKGNIIFVGKSYATFTEYTENTIFPSIFWERLLFAFRLKNKIIFSARSYSSFQIFWEHLEKENMVFVQSITRFVALHPLLWREQILLTFIRHLILIKSNKSEKI